MIQTFLLNFLLRRIALSESDIVSYRVLKQIHILKYHRNLAP